MRSKEDAHDYRYFPDPDLLPLELENSFIQKIKNELTELPDQKKDRFINEYRLSNYEAAVLTADKATADFFEKVAKNSDVKLATTWIMGDFFASLNKLQKSISNSPITVENFASLLNLIKTNIISGRIAKEVFEIMLLDKRDPKIIVEENGLIQQTDVKEIEKIIDKVLIDNQDKVTEYKSGKVKLFGFFVGSVIKESKGKANPGVVNDLLKNKLS